LVAFVAILPSELALEPSREGAFGWFPPGRLDPQRIQLQHQILLI
jgi:hypothetical protein